MGEKQTTSLRHHELHRRSVHAERERAERERASAGDPPGGAVWFPQEEEAAELAELEPRDFRGAAAATAVNRTGSRTCSTQTRNHNSFNRCAAEERDRKRLA